MDTKWNGTDRDPGGEVEYFVAAQAREAAGPETAEETARPQKGTAVKEAIGFLAFFLGLALALGSLGALAGRMISRRDAGLIRCDDWQETEAFRDQVSAYLRAFLSLGAADTTGNAWYQTAEARDVVIGSGERRQYTEVILSDTGREVRPAAEVLEEGEERGTAPDGVYRQDKNVLYFITRNNELRYTNTEEKTSRRFSDRGFEGYNFYLTYYNGAVSIVKDGAELDVYGDGTYTEGQSRWFVPGDENLQAGDWLDGVRVCMAVRQEPVRYWVQDADGGQYYYGRMYQAARQLEEAHAFYLRHIVLLGLGMLWLCVWLAFRREKRLADARVASWTRHVWTEVWLVLAAAPVLWIAVWGNWQELYWVCREIWWSYESVYLGQIVYGLLSFFLSSIPALLVAAFFLWLVYNNRRYNPGERRKSLLRAIPRGLKKLRQTLGSLYRVLRAADLKRPIEKRLTWIIGTGTAALAVVLAGLLLLLAALLPNVRWYGALWVLITLGLALAALAVLALLVSSARSLRLGRDLGRLNDRVEAIRAGDLERPLNLPEDADLRKTAEALNDIQAGMRLALADQTRSERMKVELVSNVSHDLKTPLTSILSYAELLRREDLPPAAADYARIIDEKAQRLKSMVQDVFEVSKAASDQLPVTLERLDLGKLLRQTLADLDDPIQKSGLTFKVDLPDAPVMVEADGKRLYRVFQNLIDNALRYALAGSRVYLTLKTREGQAETSIRNTSRDEIPEGVDFTARFVRGDESRTDGGSGLGLSIASSFTEACGGAFRVETLADLFTAIVTFPLAEAEQEAAR